MKGLEKFIKNLSLGGAYLAVIALIFMCAIMNYEMIVRRFFNQPTGFADEIAAYLLVVLFFSGVAYTFLQGAHISVHVVVSRLSPSRRRKLEILTAIISLAFLVLLTRESFLVFFSSYKYNSKSMSFLETPLYLPQVFMFIGLVIFVAVFFLYIKDEWKKPK